MNQTQLIAFCAVGLLSCGSSSSDRAAKAKSALDNAQISLSDSVTRSEDSEEKRLVASRAQLVGGSESTFKVQASSDISKELQLDRSGKIMSALAVGSLPPSCPGATTLKDAIGIAEKASGGRAFQIQADDDDVCLYEVQTLAGATVWEVKIDRNGAVIEKEDATDDDAED